MWPFRRRRRTAPDVKSEMDKTRLEIARLKVSVAQQVAADDPRMAAALLWGGAKGAAQTLTAREPTLAEKYLEAKLLRDSDDDGFDRLLKVRQLIREEREEYAGEYDRTSGVERAMERFGPTLLAGLASMLNPAGVLAALAAQQQQNGLVAQPPTPPPGGTNAGMVAPAPPPPLQSGAVMGPPADAEQADDQDQDEENSPDVINFPGLRPSVVLANLDSMPPAVFAHWALEQPVLGEQLRALSQQSDDQVWKSLEIASQNPLAGGFKAVFEWLRQHPQQSQAIIEAMRAMTVQLDADSDVAI